MSIKKTQEQQDILNFINTSTENLCINALAGTGKTTTLVQVVEELIYKQRVRPSQIVTLCFARRNREDFARKMPDGVTFYTFNALGYKAWREARGKTVLDQWKSSNILRQALGLQRDNFPDFTRAISLLKNNAYVPKSIEINHGGNSDEGVIMKILQNTNLDTGNLEDDEVVVLLNRALHTSIYWAYGRPDPVSGAFPPKKEKGASIIDFDDQLYMPTLFGGIFDTFPYVLVDEAQDLSPIQHRMVQAICSPDTRFIMVGDPRQAIYAFRGALANSFHLLSESFGCVSFPLSYNFRCSQAVIKEAQYFAPSIKAWDEAPIGAVEKPRLWNIKDVQLGDAILCRNNAPLVRAFYALLKEQIPAAILGKDIGKTLVAIAEKKLGGGLNFQMMERAIDTWAEQAHNKAASKEQYAKMAAVRDNQEIFHIINGVIKEQKEQYHRQFVLEIKRIFEPENAPVILCTIHKSKGFEWPNVWFMDPHLIPGRWAKDPADIEQENNLKYVGITRAKNTLSFVRSDSIKEN
jgi:superfamily I DNA/RNA helicase